MKRMFSGFKSVWVNLFSWRTEKKNHIKTGLTHKDLFGNTQTPVCLLLTSHSLDDLVRHVSDLFDWKWLKVILLKEIVSAEAEQLKGNADVAVVVKPIENLHTRPGEQAQLRAQFSVRGVRLDAINVEEHKRLDPPSSARVECLQLLQHLHLWQSSLTITINIFYDLQSHMGTITGKGCENGLLHKYTSQIATIQRVIGIVLTFCDQCIQPLSQRHLLLVYTQSHL